MNELKVLQDASTLIYKSVRSLAGTKSAQESFGVGAGGDISKKIDIVAEEVVLDHLRSINFPCVVLGEECGRVQITDNPQGYVIMDAIDGTTNAVRGFPFYCSSLAFAKEYTLSSVSAGVVMDLHNNRMYWASKGGGAFVDGGRMSTSRGELNSDIIGINISGAALDIVEKMQPIMSEGHIRHMGANALEMAIFAEGLMDAFIDLREKIRIQDIAAGYLLVHESGGLLLDENLKSLDGDLGYDTRLSFIAAADMNMVNSIAEKIGMAPLAGFEHASQP
ncbi:MAG: fructose 1,6-bisphosphatase [Cenarchaeum sp. SB0665_bin_23]|nr:fructose 1,6-bisphosphatase [Cenarchaeum sp. SB0667_bin_13]MXY61519.1 fructose 1,6-bisphosphatase [Cenarchaeum sp. SB0665_bin_23]MXZ93178.1 fructose 1,6-bisphosphatase [Cenarchaeum sp. SB0666_bin_15]MYB47052.1 fructose 1,6-bisphosphatase [Cenarchaeum sp. SB0662_bin_33]MYC80198.1 fructose 1,6-bisphosphatase [Cenarchaeum sp. SB0661_bin_35]MYD58140.1 fructose 1,6-bisphosphatase [Cenarchaeum sp. SB0678_bin_8]MYG32594.1 fructose 1,6-bisphosphatase [Cenarchaeum sp. SB0677_bin_16]MYI51586.1 fruc